MCDGEDGVRALLYRARIDETDIVKGFVTWDMGVSEECERGAAFPRGIGKGKERGLDPMGVSVTEIDGLTLPLCSEGNGCV